jgi:aromatic-amino-acid transaminase
VNYSSPPATGARLVSTILADEKLTRAWKQDLERMRQRIQEMRFSLRKSIEAKRPGVDFSYLTSQRGMFSFTGLTQEQVHALREERGVYLVGNGRLCVAGLTSANVERVAAAIVSVI